VQGYPPITSARR